METRSAERGTRNGRVVVALSGGAKALAEALFIVVLVGLVSLPVLGTDTAFFAAGSNAYGATNFYTIVPAVGDKVAIVRTLEVTTDLTAARVTTFTNGPAAVFPYSVSSSNIQVEASGTNGLAAGDNVLIHLGNAGPNGGGDRYYRVRVVTVTTTNVLYTPTITETLPAGSRMYRVGTNTFFYGMTNGLTSPKNSFVAIGQRGQPMLIDVNAAAAGSINATGEFSAAR